MEITDEIRFPVYTIMDADSGHAIAVQLSDE